MKLRKLVSALVVCLLILIFPIAGCAPKTEYGDNEIIQIKTQVGGGEVAVDALYTRTFDFIKGKITDEIVVDNKELNRLIDSYNSHPSDYPEYAGLKQYKAYLNKQYNIPKKIADFTNAQADDFIKKVISFGICTWEDNYINQTVLDAGSLHFVIKFRNGSEKTTDFYQQYPSNFKEIEAAFPDCFGVELQYSFGY